MFEDEINKLPDNVKAKLILTDIACAYCNNSVLLDYKGRLVMICSHENATYSPPENSEFANEVDPIHSCKFFEKGKEQKYIEHHTSVSMNLPDNFEEIIEISKAIEVYQPTNLGQAILAKNQDFENYENEVKKNIKLISKIDIDTKIDPNTFNDALALLHEIDKVKIDSIDKSIEKFKIKNIQSNKDNPYINPYIFPKAPENKSPYEE